jgi:uncharacterized protein (DUF1697 family)
MRSNAKKRRFTLLFSAGNLRRLASCDTHSGSDRMNTYVAFFRGINVGGNNPLPMKELVAALENFGARKVRTYIQSGNAIFESTEKNLSYLSKQLSAEINKHRGFEPLVHILTLEALSKAIAGNPFPDATTDPSSLHLGFLSSSPKSPNLEKLSALKKDSERFLLAESVFYLHAPEGVGRSKLAANSEKLLGVPMTDRNWKTVCKVMEMAGL